MKQRDTTIKFGLCGGVARRQEMDRAKPLARRNGMFMFLRRDQRDSHQQ